MEASGNAPKKEQGRLIVSQDFTWHDAGAGATYIFGRDGYLAMDGTGGPIRCSRPITGSNSDPCLSIRLRFRVALGKPYRIDLLDSDGGLVAGCRIDRNGRLRSAKNGSAPMPGKSLTYHCRFSYADETTRPSYVVPSDEHSLRIELTHESVSLALDDSDPVEIGTRPSSNMQGAKRLELSSEEAGPGNLILLREYAECYGNAVVYRERFPVCWQPVPAPPDDAPDDNVCETKTRPTDDRWLETTTAYGYLKAGVPSLRKGLVTFEMKTTDATLESCLILEENRGIIKYGNIQLGLLRGRMVLCTREGPTEFDQSVEVANNRTYRIKVAWDAQNDVVRMWVDEVAMTKHGDGCFTFANLPERGIDTITLHPGDSTARSSHKQRSSGASARPVKLLRTYWGRFRVYEVGS